MKVYQDKCDGCETCAKGCLMSAITVTNGKANIDQSKCASCGRCANECPNNAARYK